jgi:FlaA1/EpsC-like NDP-sugar epimerase
LISKRKDEGEIPVVFTELRPGDKMCEAMLSSRESYATSLDAGRPLRGIASPAPPAEAMDEILQQLQRACRDRSLDELLAWILKAVPEYQPSALLQRSLVPSGNTDRGMA